MRRTKAENRCERRQMRHRQPEKHNPGRPAGSAAGAAGKAIKPACQEQQRHRSQKQPRHTLADGLFAHQPVAPADRQDGCKETCCAKACAQRASDGRAGGAKPVINNAGGIGAEGRVIPPGREQRCRKGEPGQDQDKARQFHHPPAKEGDQGWRQQPACLPAIRHQPACAVPAWLSWRAATRARLSSVWSWSCTSARRT